MVKIAYICILKFDQQQSNLIVFNSEIEASGYTLRANKYIQFLRSLYDNEKVLTKEVFFEDIVWGKQPVWSDIAELGVYMREIFLSNEVSVFYEEIGFGCKI